MKVLVKAILIVVLIETNTTKITTKYSKRIKTMKILFLDDDLNRHQIFKQNLPGIDIDQAFSAKDAIEKINKNTYNVVFLDHDLSEHHYRDESSNDDETGQMVAKYISNNKEKFPNDVVIVLHSLNPVGRAEMKKILKNFPCVVDKPFAWMYVEKIDNTLISIK